MPKDNDSLINDILNELANKSQDTPVNETAPQPEEQQIVENDIPVRDELSDDFAHYEPVKDEEELFIENALEESNEEAEKNDYFIDEDTDDEENNAGYVSENQYNQPPVNRPHKKKKKKKKRNRLPGVLILTTLIFAISISLSLVIIAFGKDV